MIHLIYVRKWGSGFLDPRAKNVIKNKSHMFLLSLEWLPIEHDDDSNHRPLDCLIKRLFSRWPMVSPHKGPATRGKIFPFDYVIMMKHNEIQQCPASHFELTKQCHTSQTKTRCWHGEELDLNYFNYMLLNFFCKTPPWLLQDETHIPKKNAVSYEGTDDFISRHVLSAWRHRKGHTRPFV